MKLYTEEQVKHAIKMARSSYNLFTTPFIYEHDQVIEQLTPIELPTDEQIRHFAFMNYSHLHDENKPFIDGMKCMRDKIQGDNK
jgi:hypothetical protein